MNTTTTTANADTYDYGCFLVRDGEAMAKIRGYDRQPNSVVTLKGISGMCGTWKCRVSYSKKWARQADAIEVAIESLNAGENDTYYLTR